MTTPSQRSRTVELLVFGFGTSVAMWFSGYLARLPGIEAPSSVLGGVLLVCLAAGGWVAGRQGSGGLRLGLRAGLVTAALNLLVLGSLLGGGGGGGVRVSAVLWLPGSFLATAVLVGAGAAAGAASQASPSGPRDWPFWFAAVAAVATLLLLVVGGVVTSHKAGLAVVDWPNSFGTNMFLFPLSRMTGGVYYEHAHRLFGSLVGLTTVALAVVVHLSDRREWLRRFSLLAVAAVLAQGILGGLRVTGRLTLSADPSQTAPSLTLAIVHGVFGQLFFGMVVALAVFLSATFRSVAGPVTRRSAGVDRGLSALLASVLLVQLVLGAIQRHLAQGLLIHISLAVVVIGLAFACGSRAAGLYRDLKVLRSTGLLLSVAIALQVSLGILAVVAIGVENGPAGPAAWQVALRAAHQATGAVLLACAISLAIWTRRLVTPPAGTS